MTRPILSLALVFALPGACDTPDPLPAQAAPPAAAVASPDLAAPRFRLVAGAKPAPDLSAEAAAERLVRAEAKGFTPGALAAVRHKATHDHGDKGVVVVFEQAVDGVEVDGTETRVLLRADHSAVSVAFGLRADVSTAGVIPAAKVPPADALALAITDMTGVDVGAGDLRSLGGKPDGWEHIDGVVPGLRMAQPNRVRRILVPTATGLVPAWKVEVMAQVPGEPTDARLYLLDARDGAVLRQTSLRSEAHDYRVWADPSGAPAAPTAEDIFPHPTGLPGFQPHFVQADVHTLDGFNTAPGGGFDPWLPPGQTAFDGNNARGYVDRDGVDGLTAGDLDPVSDPSGAFLADYDFLGPADADNQEIAALTSAFYVVNWMHDWYYDSGFTETAGAYQGSNYGRGGVEGDPLLLETADPDQPDNAFALSFDEGRSAVLSFGLLSPASDHAYVVPTGGDPSLSVIGQFSPQTFDRIGDLVAPLDAAGSTLGCAAFTVNLSRQVVVIDRGTCAFEIKVLNATAAGAVGVIIANNIDTSLFVMGGSTGAVVSPPAVLVSRGQGAELRGLASQPGAQVRLRSGVRGDVAMDTGVVMHEWGHSLQWRLNPWWDGYSWGEAITEGTADFVALHARVQEGDDVGATYPAFSYGIYQPVTTYTLSDLLFAGRRFPYSTDRAVNGLSFRHIRDGETLPNTPMQRSSSPNSESHNAGEVVASVLFEGWMALVETTQAPGATRTFDEVKRTMSDYLVLGLQAAPPYANFTELRDGVLAAAAASNMEDARILADAFASRGLGTCAVSPAGDDTTFQGVVEDTVLRPAPVVSVTLQDDVESCDSDGILDPGERGTVSVVVQNASMAPLRGAVLQLGTTTPGLLLADTELAVPDVGPLGEVTLDVPAALRPGGRPMQAGALTAVVEHPDTCGPVEAVLDYATYTDVVFRTTDSFEATELTDWTVLDWTLTGPGRDPVWSTVSPVAYVVTPPLHVGSTGLRFSFRHRYDQPTFVGVPTGGGFLLVTADEGLSWYDASTFANPAYNGVYQGGNAYTGRSPGWPAWQDQVLDFGHQFDGQTVYVEFLGLQDGPEPTPGWELDAIAVDGLIDAPFGGYVADASPDADGDQVCDAVDRCAGDDGGGDNNLDGVCDFGLRMGNPRAGQVLDITALNAPAGSNVVFLASTSPRGGPTCHPTLAACTSLGRPVVLGTVPASGAQTVLQRRLPAALLGEVLRVEAVAVDAVSGVASGVVAEHVTR